MKAIMCDACNNVIKEKDVQYFNLGFGRAELCKECKEKAKEIFKKSHSNVFISAVYEFTGKADYHEKVIN